MQSLNTLALVKGTFFSVSVFFDLSPNKKNNNKKNNNNKVKCKLTLRVSKNVEKYLFGKGGCVWMGWWGVAYASKEREGLSLNAKFCLVRGG